jgi:hypothetical protein
VTEYGPGFGELIQDLLDIARAKMYGLGGILPSRGYTKEVNPQYDRNTDYSLRGVYKNKAGDYVGDFSPLPREAKLPEFDTERYEQKTKPFISERETLEDYMRRISVSDIPENLLVKDDEGRIVRMVQPPAPSYALPDRRGAQFFAP